MSHRGRLTIFEGPDDVGKSRFCAEAVKRLRQAGEETIYYAFPGREPNTLGELVYRIHHDRSVIGGPVSSAALQAMHIAAHIDAIERVLRPVLMSGISVVLDRFWWSTRVYGLGDGVSDELLRALVRAERLVWGTILPSQLFYIRADKPRPTFQGNLEQWRYHRTAYNEMFINESGRYPMHIIDNNGTPESAMASIMATLNGTPKNG